MHSFARSHFCDMSVQDTRRYSLLLKQVDLLTEQMESVMAFLRAELPELKRELESACDDGRRLKLLQKKECIELLMKTAVAQDNTEA